MSFSETAWPREKEALYPLLRERLGALLAGERDWIANLANAAALIWEAMPDLNWAGFYRMEENGGLVLGPFQGKPACVRISRGKGVCGTAAASRQPQLVPDVHAFPGHIPCDSASRSELVIPLFDSQGQVAGVLDLDSPLPGRFTREDLLGLLPVAEVIQAACFGEPKKGMERE
jgi:L-methionine (R)-S-oxide reductase